MSLDANQDVSEIRLRIDVMSDARCDQRLQNCQVLPCCVVADEHEIFPSQRHGAQRAFGDIIVRAQFRVIQINKQGGPGGKCISDGLSHRAFWRMTVPLIEQPRMQRLEQRTCFAVSQLAVGLGSQNPGALRFVLIGAILRRDLGRAHPNGGLRVSPNLRLQGPDGEEPDIYLMGSRTRGSNFATASIQSVARASDIVAKQIKRNVTTLSVYKSETTSSNQSEQDKIGEM